MNTYFRIFSCLFISLVMLSLQCLAEEPWVVSAEDRAFYADYLNLLRDRASYAGISAEFLSRSNGDYETSYVLSSNFRVQPKLYGFVRFHEWLFEGESGIKADYLNHQAGFHQELKGALSTEVTFEHQGVVTGGDWAVMDKWGSWNMKFSLAANLPWNDSLATRQLDGSYHRFLSSAGTVFLTDYSFYLEGRYQQFMLGQSEAYEGTELKGVVSLSRQWSWRYDALRLAWVLETTNTESSALPIPLVDIQNHSIRLTGEHSWGFWQWWGYPLWSVVEATWTRKVLQETDATSLYLETQYRQDIYHLWTLSLSYASSEELVGNYLERRLLLGWRWYFR
ncbi:MAG: hypothetical protein HQM12_15285 [SAR324 cluster bacterium]|nr:hypothetical protein [SAR324 cluster bacterium]